MRLACLMVHSRVAVSHPILTNFFLLRDLGKECLQRLICREKEKPCLKGASFDCVGQAAKSGVIGQDFELVLIGGPPLPRLR